jgi:hypothetical protein
LVVGGVRSWSYLINYFDSPISRTVSKIVNWQDIQSAGAGVGQLFLPFFTLAPDEYCVASYIYKDIDFADSANYNDLMFNACLMDLSNVLFDSNSPLENYSSSVGQLEVGNPQQLNINVDLSRVYYLRFTGTDLSLLTAGNVIIIAEIHKF